MNAVPWLIFPVALDFHLLLYIKGNITTLSDEERRYKVIRRQSFYK